LITLNAVENFTLHYNINIQRTGLDIEL